MEVARVAALEAPRARVADFVELTKPRITTLVLVTTAVGYALGLRGSFTPAAFLALLAGTALLSCGASVLNQYAERDADARMRRTERRPLPSGRIAPGDALAFGLVLSAAGLSLLATLNGLTYILGAAALGSYVLAYTPLKRVTSLCTVVGAVPGAIPPLMGWAAARGGLEAGAWALFAVVFLWQLPHFLAIGWIYREDYARGGFPILTVTDASGRSAGRQALLYAAALLPTVLGAGALSAAGTLFLWAGLFLGAAFLFSAAVFARARSQASARWLFLSSVVYLPAVLGLMVFDR